MCCSELRALKQDPFRCAMRVSVRVAVGETEYVSKCGTGVWCSEDASLGTIQFYVTSRSECMSDMTHSYVSRN